MIFPPMAGLLGGGEEPFIGYFQSDYRDTSGGNTFNDWNLGPEQDDRVIYFIYTGQNNGPTGVTINGVSATSVRSHTYGSIHISLWAAAVPTGETVTLSISGATLNTSLVTTFSAYGGYPTTSYADNSNNNATSITCDVPADGLVLGASVHASTTALHDWLGGCLTQGWGEGSFGGEETMVGSEGFLDAETPRTFTTDATATYKSLLVASFEGPPLPSYSSAFAEETDKTINGTGSASYTFSAQDIGAAAADRIVAVTIGGERNAATGDLDTVTIGGVSATIIKVSNGASPNYFTAIAYASVPTGTTADVVVNFTLASNGCGIRVFRITGAAGLDASTTDTDATSLSLAVKKGAAVILAGGVTDAASRPFCDGVMRNIILSDGNYRFLSAVQNQQKGTVIANFSNTMRSVAMASFI